MGYPIRLRLTIAAAVALLACAASSVGAEIQAVVKRIDLEQRSLVVTAGQQQRAIRVRGENASIDAGIES